MHRHCLAFAGRRVPFCLFLISALGCATIIQAQNYTVLHTFTGWADGMYPSAALIRDAAGNLYGTAPQGGAGASAGCPPEQYYGCGVAFKLDATGNETVYPLTGLNGYGPGGSLIMDSAGNLYGTAYGGGGSGYGVVFKIDTTNAITVLHSFTGSDGAYPRGSLLRDSAGNLYGTTASGGGSKQGVVFKLDPAGNEKVLYSFTGGADGGAPQQALIRDSEGNLYSTTFNGGISSRNCLPGGVGTCGVVFKLDSSGNETVLYSFTGGADGGNPYGLVRDSAGNLYGATFGGGVTNSQCVLYGCGVVFKLDTSNKETVLHTFTGGADGLAPYSSPIRDSAGNLYGTTESGGTAGGGVVYKLDAGGNETILYSFEVGAGGSNPTAGVIGDSAGNLYGTAPGGGVTAGVCAGSHGCGVVFKLAP